MLFVTFGEYSTTELERVLKYFKMFDIFRMKVTVPRPPALTSLSTLEGFTRWSRAGRSASPPPTCPSPRAPSRRTPRVSTQTSCGARPTFRP